MRGATRPSACHLVLEAQRAFRPHPVAKSDRLAGVRRLLISSIYRVSPNADDGIMHRGCCTV